MGMFDYIKYSCACPECGAIVREWQSKDGPCVMSTLDPWRVENFYTSCPGCKTWLDANVTADVEEIVHSLTVDVRSSKS
jgi:hypothetical protein